MHNEFDLVTIVSLINSIFNIVFTIRLRSVEVNKQLISDLRDTNKDQEAIIDDLREKKNQYKQQYQHQLMENKTLIGRLQVYEKNGVEVK